jgi:hypothetical protein
MNNIANELSGYINIIPVIIGGILTFLGGITGNQLLQRRQRKNDREHLSATFAGDIFAILSIIKKRNYEEELNNALDRLRNHEERVIFARPIEGDYLMVYKQNVGKLGVLESSLAGEIVIFYTYITVLLDDNREVVNIDVNTANLRYIAVRHEETLNLLRETVERGNKVLNTLITATKRVGEHHSTQVKQIEG